MQITEQPSLLSLNTFGLSAGAGLLVVIESEEDVISMPGFNSQTDVILGGGSNIVFVDDVPGTVYLNRIRGIEVVEDNDHQVLIEVGAGENWHDLVLWCVARNYSGLENLALIPGLAGAAPIQNIGAYGVELSSVVNSVTAWDFHSQCWHLFDRQSCEFGYRSSVFKSTGSERYLITSISLKLNKEFLPRLEYAGLQSELEQAGVTEPQLADVCQAVIRLRQRKLPDPAKQGNVGSFFKNPVVTHEQLESLHIEYPALPAWGMDHQQSKISAAWMIEQCGLKGYEHQGAAVSERHALVLINKQSATGSAVRQLAQHIRSEVKNHFGITLEPEPRIYQPTI